MTTNTDYQNAELKRHAAEMVRKEGYFADVAEFEATMSGCAAGWIKEQTGWIINGSYGAGACLALQRVLNNLTPRCNKEAVVGQFILSGLYGRTWKSGDWHKLTTRTRKEVTKAAKWVLGLKNPAWAMKLEV